jgi:hypothetical protein
MNTNTNNIDLANIDLTSLGLNTSNLGLDTLPLSEEHKQLLENVSSMLESQQLQSAITCDDECRKNKKEEMLFQEYVNAQNMYKNAPKELEKAEEKFYSFSKGGAWFQNFKEENAGKSAEKLISTLKGEFIEYINRLNVLNKTYNSQKKYTSTIKELNNKYEEKINSAKKQKDNLQNISNISNRNYEYDVNNIAFYDGIKKYTFRFTLILLIIYCIYIFGVKRLFNKKQIIFTIIFTITLFNISFISEKVVDIYEYYSKVTTTICELEEYEGL